MARRFAARIGVIREAAGVTAYRAGQFAEALGDLRAARRMTGSDAYLPIMADCERGLGRPERALDLVRSREAERLDRPERIELTIVESGARRDLGQQDAALVTLQRLPELRDPRPQPWSARLAYAYADALAEAGHAEAAADWFGRAMAFDEDGETEAAARYSELTGDVIGDIEDIEEDYQPEGDAADDGEIDDLADLDRQIEDEDDLDELDFEGQHPPADSAPEPVEAAPAPVAAVAEPAAEEPPTREPAAEDAAEEPLAEEPKDETGHADDLDVSDETDDKGDDEEPPVKTAGESPIAPAFIEPDFGDSADASDESDEPDRLDASDRAADRAADRADEGATSEGSAKRKS
ncbi:hypothetical protein [Spongiactinospora sp. TRM90649]|uniref:hypothetical protein n=1 Tax=Spongiactinospora sp. TRM90649 TaxID=3031114 RepID=UPI0023F8326B|nr:hypothetical protein [Spongiactinospora sp. TRM90649]MDF5759238.1 hypothetical protein [Spongiactinospora sp. TRM90649]